MTQLTNLVIGASYGDVLTTTNNGQGLTTNLLPLQDGLGNNSTISIATNQVNFDRSGGSTFQLDGVPLISLTSIINQVCTPNPVLPGTGGVVLPQGTFVQRQNVTGTMRFNTQSAHMEYFNGTVWVVF
jgi:hypothetical protein